MNIIMKPSNSPTQGQPDPRQNRLKVAFGPLPQILRKHPNPISSRKTMALLECFPSELCTVTAIGNDSREPGFPSIHFDATDTKMATQTL